MLVGSVACAGVAILVPGSTRLAVHRRRPDAPAEQGLFAGASDAVGRIMQRRGTQFPLLELSGVKLSAQDMVVRTVLLTFVLGVLGFFQSPWLGILLAILSPLGVWVWLLSRRDERRKKFGQQLDDTLQMLAGSMRAGHSLASGLQFVAAESPEPMATELKRAVNETRMGRDLNQALAETHARMDNVDFGWVVQAIAINRQVGGNLAEVLVAVSQTIRERDRLRGQVKSLSAEGKMSALILMGLPLVVILILSLSNPTYLGVLLTEPLGWIFIGVASVLFVVGGIWMRSVTKVQF